MDNFEIEVLFRERKQVGSYLQRIMEERGYTKISFSKAVNISRPTLNHLFKGEISSITTFEKHIEKISGTLGLKSKELIEHEIREEIFCPVVYSCNEPEDYKPQEKEREMFDILESLIDLCDFYY